MTKNLKVELDELEKVSKVWLSEVSPGLKSAAGSIDALKYTAVQFGPLFIGAWSSYSKAAAYIQDRLREAEPVAEQIGSALHAAVVSFGEQQAEQVQATDRLAGDMDFSI
ncbi:hypothetical protein [Nocardia salmonicida]|uniref:hypothetical protein n=1 Tax=Nocardia salmonicida TaxID=53431 RepID=UPI00340CB1B1